MGRLSLLDERTEQIITRFPRLDRGCPGQPQAATIAREVTSALHKALVVGRPGGLLTRDMQRFLVGTISIDEQNPDDAIPIAAGIKENELAVR